MFLSSMSLLLAWQGHVSTHSVSWKAAQALSEAMETAPPVPLLSKAWACWSSAANLGLRIRLSMPNSS